jgi:hypothetical protein
MDSTQHTSEDPEVSTECTRGAAGVAVHCVALLHATAVQVVRLQGLQRTVANGLPVIDSQSQRVLKDTAFFVFATTGFKPGFKATQSQLSPFWGCGFPAATSIVEHTWNLSRKTLLVNVVTA